MDKYVDVEGAKVFVQIEGEGKPIVLVHGWALNHEMWKFQIPYLKDNGYQVVAIDLRGFGNSDKPPAGYTYETWATDLGTVIEKLDLQNATLVGYSIGGAIAMYYVTTRFDPRIEKLALVAAAGPYMTWNWENPWDNPWGQPRGFWDGLIFLIDREKREYAFQQFYQSAFPKMGPEDWQWIQRMLESASPQALIGGLEEIRDKDFRPTLDKIPIKTRISHGILDPIVRYGLAEEQQRLITGAKLTTFWNSGHGLFFEEGDKLNQELDW